MYNVLRKAIFFAFACFCFAIVGCGEVSNKEAKMTIAGYLTQAGWSAFPSDVIITNEYQKSINGETVHVFEFTYKGEAGNAKVIKRGKKLEGDFTWL